jgi:hypothetical protein
MIIDENWIEARENIFLRESPTQPAPDKFTYYEIVNTKNCVMRDHRIPTLNNRKEIERLCLERKLIRRKAKLQEFLDDNPDLPKKLLDMDISDYGDMYGVNTHFLRSPSNEVCYERYSVPSDDKYRRGMSVIASLRTEEILLRHFDNVVSNAISAGYDRISEDEATLQVNRYNKLNTIL